MKDIVEVRVLGHWRLLLTFKGGERREVDVSKLVTPTGVFEPLRDTAFFAQVRVEPDLGTIAWPNGADLCPDVLYERGKPATSHRSVTAFNTQ